MQRIKGREKAMEQCAESGGNKWLEKRISEKDYSESILHCVALRRINFSMRYKLNPETNKVTELGQYVWDGKHVNLFSGLLRVLFQGGH